MPFFSPDGEWVGFFDAREGTLKRVRLDGSEIQTLGSTPPTTRSAGWGVDGTIVLNSGSSEVGGLARVQETGGVIEPIGHTLGEGGLAWLDLLPGGVVVLGGGRSLEGERGIVAVPLATGEPKFLFQGSTPRYLATGHIVYLREGALWVRPFDAERLEATGDATLVVQGVRSGGNGLGEFAVSETLLVYRAGGERTPYYGLPVWVDREGNEEPLPIDAGLYTWPRISPDGMKVALVRLQDNEDVWIYDLQSGVSTQLTIHPAVDQTPIWTPDSERVVFRSTRDGASNLYSRSADGSDDVERLTDSPFDQRPHGFTPDGLTLLFEQADPGFGETTPYDVWELSLESGADPVPLMQEAFSEAQPAVSPNGRFIVYESSEQGYPEIFVRPFPDLEGDDAAGRLSDLCC